MAERTPEEIGEAVGEAMADSILSAVRDGLEPLAKSIRAVQEDHAAAREEIHGLKQRVETLERQARRWNGG